MDLSKAKPKEEARVTSCSSKSITVSHLADDEADRFQAAMLGNGWIRCRDGRIQFEPSHQPLPSPTDDPLLPWWRPLQERPGTGLQMEIFDEERLRPGWSASILISSLCGYNYTPENYKQQAERLERYGFTCFRSQRDNDSRFGEFWYLPGLWAAKDRLAYAIKWKEEIETDDFGLPVMDPEITYTKIPQENQLAAALEFLRRNCQFGSCDVTIQRLAQAIPD